MGTGREGNLGTRPKKIPKKLLREGRIGAFHMLVVAHIRTFRMKLTLNPRPLTDEMYTQSKNCFAVRIEPRIERRRRNSLLPLNYPAADWLSFTLLGYLSQIAD